MPIEGVSNIVRIPRLGKIHLGIKVEQPGKSPYPKAVDYFVCPPEIQAEFGEKPKELEIMFPTEDPDQFAQQWLRCYSLTQGLVCIGDGVSARRKFDLATGDLAGRDTRGWEWKEVTCDYEACPEYLAKRCRRVMNLQVLIPRVPGLGVWQIDTTSRESIININNMVTMLKGTLGRCSLIPLTLALGPVEVTPQGQTKKTVYIMHIKKDVRLADLARLAQLPPAKVLLPEPAAEEPPEDLFPQEILAEAENRSAGADGPCVRRGRTPGGPLTDVSAPAEEIEEPAPLPQAIRDPATVRTLNDLYKACHEDWDMQPKDVIHDLGYRSQMDIVETPTECYLKIRAMREG
jgi:hypothetical protein